MVRANDTRKIFTVCFFTDVYRGRQVFTVTLNLKLFYLNQNISKFIFTDVYRGRQVFRMQLFRILKDQKA